MARLKKTAEPVIETAVEETVLTEAVESAPVETPIAPQDNSADIARIFAEVEYELAKLGHIGHLYYAKKVGERLSELTRTLKNLL